MAACLFSLTQVAGFFNGKHCPFWGKYKSQPKSVVNMQYGTGVHNGLKKGSHSKSAMTTQTGASGHNGLMLDETIFFNTDEILQPVQSRLDIFFGQIVGRIPFGPIINMS